MAWAVLEREDAARYLLISNVSFALSVALVRFFLTLTGFPQIGGGDLHISHVLWGGLLLFVAVLAVLVVDHPWAYTGSAILSGVGIGLFIDEVGKFITKDYNYFYPAAAPIIYVFFLLTLYVYLRIRRPDLHNDLDEMIQALELIEDDLGRPLAPEEWDELNWRLEDVANGEPSDRKTKLAHVLLDYLHSESRPPVVPASLRWWQRAREAARRWLKEGRLRALLVLGFGLLGLLAFKYLVQMAPWTPANVSAVLQIPLLGEAQPAQSAPGLFSFRVVLETLVGVLFLVSAVLLALKRTNLGVGLGYLSLFLTLLALDIAVFYFDQFSTILPVAFQFLVLLGLLDFRRRFPVSLDTSPAYLRVFIEKVERGLTLRPRRTRRRKKVYSLG